MAGYIVTDWTLLVMYHCQGNQYGLVVEHWTCDPEVSSYRPHL